jgi:hypothetical protein
MIATTELAKRVETCLACQHKRDVIDRVHGAVRVACARLHGGVLNVGCAQSLVRLLRSGGGCPVGKFPACRN